MILKAGLFAAAVVLAGAGFALRPAPVWQFAVPQVPVDNRAPAFETVFDYDSPVGTAHAAAIKLTAVGFDVIWFDGLRESSNDVEIFQAQFSEDQNGWHVSKPEAVLSRQSASAVMHPRQTVLTLGNVIEHEGHPDALLATIVSVGGWAMASIAHVDMVDNAPVRAEKLNLSPLLNRSFLVKSSMIGFADGDSGLPAYYELGNAFGALVRLNAQGRVVGLRRMAGGVRSIQPSIVVKDPLNAVAFLRNFDLESDRLLASWTTDGGHSWSAPSPLDLPNPNAPVAALRLPDGQILMVFNDDAIKSDVLRFALSQDDGRTWQRKAALESRGGDARYPAMRYLPDGRIALTYSVDGKTGIRVHVFTQRWVLDE